MIRPPFDRPDVLAKLRPAWSAARSLILPGACDPASRPRPPFREFDLAHRGKYGFADLSDDALLAELRAFAAALTGARLGSGAARLFRFRRGGYALFYDDALSRLTAGVEVTLDLSDALCGPPAIYQEPARRLEIPQAPGLVAVVERGPSTYRYDRYLPAEVGDAEVLRLRAAFPYQGDERAAGATDEGPLGVAD